MDMQTVQKKLQNISNNCLGVKVKVEDDLTEVYDMLDRYELIMYAEDAFGIELRKDEDEYLTTFGAFVITVWKAVNSKEVL